MQYTIVKPIIHLLLVSTLALLTACGGSNTNQEGPQSPEPSEKPATGIAGDGRLDLIAEYIRDENSLPALAAVMIHDGEIIEKTAVGVRAIDRSIAVTEDDQWHIGSITKSMTSTLVAKLVSEGIVDWDTTIADVFPEYVGLMLPAYEDVRVDQLLSHTSGLPVHMSEIPGWDNYFTDQRDPVIQRQEIVEIALQLTSTANRGQYEYSNMGYTIAGAMLERMTGISWESLMQNYVFEPLLMHSAGFAAPDTLGTLAQPVGHIFDNNQWIAVDPAIEEISDNPVAMGPAGIVHGSLDDMAAYAALHLKGQRGEAVDNFLSAEAFSKLHTSVENNNYSLGWNVTEQGIYHDGTNTLWFALLVVNATKNTALFIVTNAADLDLGENSSAGKGVYDLLDELGTRADAAFQ
ncbi:MAG: beta-lactamase family protein [Gammaproteobacteria bacterium]|nr:beta-lactamase family protein [Gammaproteobacteria bacterium]